MLKCIIFDPFCGASEQMILGALLGCGADEWRVRGAVEGLCGVPIRISYEQKPGMSVGLAVINDEKAEGIWPGFLTRDEALNKLNLMHETQPVRIDAMNIVKSIMDARDAIYGPGSMINIASIAMIAGICTAYDSLGRPYVQSTPAALGGGMIETSCGKFPVPRPETLEIIKGSKLITQGGPFDGELLTIEGAAILAYFVKESGRYYPENRTLAVGYGQGQLTLPSPNVLRATFCETDESLIIDRIELLETNVDDVTGELLGYLIEELLSMGAKDVSVIPATMKKGRSGHLIRVVVKAEDGPAIARRIMLETGSLGVRVVPVKHRYIAKREIQVIKVKIENNEYNMRFKIASDMEGKVLDVSVEYEDAKLVSRELSIPLKTVMRMAETEAWQKYTDVATK